MRVLKSQVSGSIDLNLEELIDRKALRFMGMARPYTHIAMQRAIEDARIDQTLLSSERTGIVMGSGGASTSNVAEAVEK